VLGVFRNLRAEARARLATGACPPFVGRTHELRRVVFDLTDPTHGRVILRGLPGVGKQAMIDYLARQLEDEDPDVTAVAPLAGWGFYAVRIAAIEARPSDWGEWLAARLRELRALGPAIVVFEDFPATIRLPGIAAVLLEMLANDMDLRVLATATFASYGVALAAEPDLVVQFLPIDLLPPTSATTQQMVTAHTRFLERQLPVRIEEAAVQRAIQLATQLQPYALPGAAIERLESVCATAVSARAAALDAVDDPPDPPDPPNPPDPTRTAGSNQTTLNEAPPIVITARLVEQTPFSLERS
jgi:ATP-dependent Clp protease ATP-binding subunit ClpB